MVLDNVTSPSEALIECLPIRYIKSYRVLPWELNQGTLTVLTDQDISHENIDFMEFYSGFKIHLEFVSEEIWKIRFESIFRDHPLWQVAQPAPQARTGPDAELVDLIRQSRHLNASDIHLEAEEDEGSVRFRVQGKLLTGYRYRRDTYQQLIAHLFQLANLPSDAQGTPCDARLTFEEDFDIYDFRLASIPSLYGTSVTLRVLERSLGFKSFLELGMSEPLAYEFQSLLSLQQGLILVVGTTGSGKTTTVNMALQSRVAEDQKIITLEDPIEYLIPGVTQLRIHEGLSFEAGLKSILRQAPNIIMVGEMRDKASAEVVVDAALSGHLVISTMHADSIEDTWERIMDFDIDPEAFSSALKGILAQRLMQSHRNPLQREGWFELYSANFPDILEYSYGTEFARKTQQP